MFGLLFDDNSGIKEWNVDTVNPQKVYYRENLEFEWGCYKEVIRKASFKAELF